MACLNKGAIARYLAGDLPYEDHQDAEAHLDSCVSCLSLLTEMTGQPEARVAASGGFQQAVTERLSIQAPQSDKMLWLERHYGLRLGDVINGKYRLEKILGEGGMGIVLLAEHIALRERVALKFMHPSMVTNAGHSARFLREARAAVKLRDENVARVLDLGEIEGTGPFIVMEYLDGQDLLAYLKAKTLLPVVEAVELIRQAASGVAAAHGAGIIHRDLKPGNMFLTERSDGSRVLKVLDFGVSKYIEGDSLSMTGTNMVVGSPMYMAPEMFESARNASLGSDIWALGVIFYRMLSGRLPFFAESLPEMVAKIHFGKPTPLTHWRPELPPELVQIIEVCLARKPSDRFSSAREFLNALAQLPARIRADPHAPTMTVAHLSREPEPTADSERFPSLPKTMASTAVTGPASVIHEIAPQRRSPWVFALVGALASAALFTGILVATKGDDGADVETTVEPVAAPAALDGDDTAPEATEPSAKPVEPSAEPTVKNDKTALDELINQPVPAVPDTTNEEDEAAEAAAMAAKAKEKAEKDAEAKRKAEKAEKDAEAKKKAEKDARAAKTKAAKRKANRKPSGRKGKTSTSKASKKSDKETEKPPKKETKPPGDDELFDPP